MTAQVTPQPFIPGPRLFGGEQLNSLLAGPVWSSQQSVTANGTSQAAGTQITATITNFTTVASSGVAILPKAVAGTLILVLNNGANTLTIYPFATTDTIDSAAAGASVSLSTTSRGAWFYAVATGVWISAIVGATTS
jgi:hypothetical protein